MTTFELAIPQLVVEYDGEHAPKPGTNAAASLRRLVSNPHHVVRDAVIAAFPDWKQDIKEWERVTNFNDEAEQIINDCMGDDKRYAVMKFWNTGITRTLANLIKNKNEDFSGSPSFLLPCHFIRHREHLLLFSTRTLQYITQAST